MKRFIASATLGAIAAGIFPVFAQDQPGSTAATARAVPALTTDYAAARQKAIAENKNLLLVFTGSDWIELCRIFQRDILSQPDFLEAIDQDFVGVLIDFPKDQVQSPELRMQNQLLMRAYRISAFPAVALTDPDGRPFAFTGYQAVSPAEYAAIIKALSTIRVDRDVILKQASEAEGVERAKLLTQAIPKLPGNLAGRYYRAELEEIIKLDPNDETGKVGICKKLIADVDYSSQMEKLSEEIEWSKMIALTDAYIGDQKLEGTEKQRALFNKVGVYESQGNIAGKIQTLLDIEKIDASSIHGRKARKILDGMRAERLQEELAPR